MGGRRIQSEGQYGYEVEGGGSFSGFSAGAGVRIKMFDVGFSLAKYHPSAMSMMISVSTTLADFKKVTE